MIDLRYEVSPAELICEICDYSIPVPYHCKKQMILKNSLLTCWKGEHQPCCNSSSTIEIPTHHERPMILKT